VGYHDVLWGAGFTVLAVCVLVLLPQIASYRDLAIRRLNEAERRASELLMDWLSPGQRAQYQRTGCFEVTGSHTGKRYRIRYARQLNVDELDDGGHSVAVWCFVPRKFVPIADMMLAQKIALENDETATIAIAFRH
jgi:hypothetical protein